jgi:hypothetical protein
MSAQNRFSTYLRGVRELTIESDSDPIDMEVLLQRYELLERIYLEHEPLTAPEVMVEETYSCGDRRIYVRGEVKFDRLDLTRQHHPVRVNERVVWRDIRSLSETIMHVSQGRDLDFVTLVRSAMSDGTSPLQGLVKLNLSRYWISMYGLEEILGSLPNLKHLSCSLKSPEYLPDRVGRQPRRIIQETGAGIQIMDVTCHGIDLFYGLSLLEGCPKLIISGDIWRDSIASLPPFSPRSAEGPRTQYLRLAPSLRSQWKHQLPDPYQIARQIRYYVSPSCTITIVTTGKYGEELLWLRILSETLKSLQKEEDQRRAETKGWTKCDPPPEHK